MASRVAAAMVVLQVLILLSLLETLFSFFFSAILGREVVFPVFVWFELLLYSLGYWLLGALHLLGTVGGAVLLFIPLDEVVSSFLDMMMRSVVLPLAVVYPVLSIADSLLLGVFQVPFFLFLIMDSFLIGWPPVLFPPPGNVAFLVANLANIPTVIANLAAGLATMGLLKNDTVSTWIFYGSLSRRDRKEAWSRYGKERTGFTGGTGSRGTGSGGDGSGSGGTGGGKIIEYPD